MFCGGYNTRRLCWEYDPLIQEWIPAGQMRVDRVAAAYAEMTDGSFWIVSGTQGEPQLTSEIYIDDEFVEGPELTGIDATTYLCVAAVTEDLTFVAAEDNVYFYNWSEGLFEDVSEGFEGPGIQAHCGAYLAEDGSQKVLLAGAYRPTIYVYIPNIDLVDNNT